MHDKHTWALSNSSIDWASDVVMKKPIRLTSGSGTPCPAWCQTWNSLMPSSTWPSAPKPNGDAMANRLCRNHQIGSFSAQATRERRLPQRTDAKQLQAHPILFRQLCTGLASVCRSRRGQHERNNHHQRPPALRHCVRPHTPPRAVSSEGMRTPQILHALAPVRVRRTELRVRAATTPGHSYTLTTRKFQLSAC